MRANLGKYERAAAEFLRALRGSRSQRAFARRLGYRGNPMTDWEHGRRFPTAQEALRAARLSGVDVEGAFMHFHAAKLERRDDGSDDLAAWMQAIAGSTPVSRLASRAGVSRFALGRWLRAQAQPRLPDFFRIVDAATGRLADLVASLVPIQQVDSLYAQYVANEAARRAAYDTPWAEAILRVLECSDYRGLARHELGWIAARLGITVREEKETLKLLRSAGLVRRRGGLLTVDQATIDTRGDPERVSSLLQHWSCVATQRISERRPADYHAYNVCSLSRADYERARALLRRTFREIRSMVAASEPAEQVVLLNLQLVRLDA